MEPKFYNALKTRAVKDLEDRISKLMSHSLYLASQDIAVSKIDERFGLFDDDHIQGHVLLDTAISMLCEAKDLNLGDELTNVIHTVHYLVAYELNGVLPYKARAITFTDRLIELTDRIQHGQAKSLVEAYYITQFLNDFPQVKSEELDKKLEELKNQNMFRFGENLPNWYPYFGSGSVIKGCSGTGAGG